MSWDELIEYNRRWVDLHASNSHQREAARRMTLLLDAMEQLRSEEAVERVARGLWYGPDQPGDRGVQLWEDAHPRSQEDLREQAREAIDALLGETDE